MKKFISLIISIVLLSSVLSVYPSAAKAVTDNQSVVLSQATEYFEDGSSIETIITEQVNPVSTFGTTFSKSGSKSTNYRNSDGDILFTFTITGSFSVTSGVSATCTTAYYTTSNLASGWSYENATATKSGNKAIGTATFNHKTLFVTTQTKDVTVTLTCDANGNLS